MTNKIPRLDFDDLEQGLADALRPRYERLGYLGEFFRCLGHQPRPLRAFVEYTETAKGELDQKMVEVVALSAATHLDNAYERNQHERLCVRLGYGRDWVTEIEKLDPEGADGLSDDERTVQRYVIDMLVRGGKDTNKGLEAVIDALGYEKAIAVMMVIGRYIMHAMMVHSLELAPPVPSIYEDGFNG